MTAHNIPRYSIGIDLGGTNLRVAAYRQDGTQLELVTLPTRSSLGPTTVLDDMSEAAIALRDRHRDAGAFAGVGIGSPGPIELPEGRLVDPSNLPGFHGLELRCELESRTGARVVVESDANAAAFAEWSLGAGRTHQVASMAMMTLGTGVGGGIILDSRVWHGSLGMAGEPGHTVIYSDGIPCNCGSRGCLEQYASATAVRRRAAELGLGAADAHAVAVSAGQGSEAALEIYREAGRALGLGIGAWIAALNLPLYVLGGGMCEAWEFFAPEMFRTVTAVSQIYRMTRPEDANTFAPGKTNILRAQLGSSAGILGAALLPFS